MVNGTEILYTAVSAASRTRSRQQQQRERRTLSAQDDTRRIENRRFDQMVAEILLQQEYRRSAGSSSPTTKSASTRATRRRTGSRSAPELQTDGQFDPEKYQRLLASPQARQWGLLVALEQYYRTEIPREKLFEQVTTRHLRDRRRAVARVARPARQRVR